MNYITCEQCGAENAEHRVRCIHCHHLLFLKQPETSNVPNVGTLKTVSPSDYHGGFDISPGLHYRFSGPQVQLMYGSEVVDTMPVTEWLQTMR